MMSAMESMSMMFEMEDQDGEIMISLARAFNQADGEEKVAIARAMLVMMDSIPPPPRR